MQIKHRKFINLATKNYTVSLVNCGEPSKANQEWTVDVAPTVSLNIFSAYNRLWTSDVLRKVKQWGISGNLLQFIKNCITHSGYNSTKTVKEEIRLPQDSVIVVKLFFVAREDVFTGLLKVIFIPVYADEEITGHDLKHQLPWQPSYVRNYSSSR